MFILARKRKLEHELDVAQHVTITTTDENTPGTSGVASHNENTTQQTRGDLGVTSNKRLCVRLTPLRLCKDDENQHRDVKEIQPYCKWTNLPQVGSLVLYATKSRYLSVLLISIKYAIICYYC